MKLLTEHIEDTETDTFIVPSFPFEASLFWFEGPVEALVPFSKNFFHLSFDSPLGDWSCSSSPRDLILKIGEGRHDRSTPRHLDEELGEFYRERENPSAPKKSILKEGKSRKS